MQLKRISNFIKIGRTPTIMLICAPLWLTACGGSSSSTDGSSTISGQATKGPIHAATVTAYALNADGSRGGFLGTTTTDAQGNYSLSVEHSGAAAVVVSGGSYVDEATGSTVSLSSGVELETLLAEVRSSNTAAVTALTTIAAARAAANASAGLANAIAAAELEVAAAFGLSGVDITSTIPSNLASVSSSQDSLSQRKYGQVQAGLTKLMEAEAMAPESVLTLISNLSADFSDGDFDGRDAAGQALNFALGLVPEQAMVGLNVAMSAFLKSPQNRSGMSIPSVTIPEMGTMISGQATKGPIAAAEVRMYALNADGTRGRLLGTTISDEAGNYALQVSHSGPAAVVVTGGSYSDEATGATVSLSADVELETLVADVKRAERVAVTALTTIAAKHAAANAGAGLEAAIAAANTDVAALFGLSGVDLAATIPSDMTSLDALGDSASAQAYGLVQSALTQIAENQNMAPEHVLTLVAGLAEDFSDGKLDGMTAAGASIEMALGLTPAEAMLGLEAAVGAFLNSPENAIGRALLPDRP